MGALAWPDGRVRSYRLDVSALARVDRAIVGLTRHWLVGANVLIGTYAILPLLTPLLAAIGASDAAGTLYWLYGYTCHQLPTHSWFLFGQKMAFCQRDTAIYASMLAGGLTYARRRDPTSGLPVWAFALLSLPLAIDGGLAALGVRESTPLLRTATGVPFGLAAAWFVYPLMDRALGSLRAPQ